MTERIVGLVVVGEAVTVVDAEVPDDAGDPVAINNDVTWKLQGGDRSKALAVLHQRCQDYITENHVGIVVVKASAVPQGSVRLGVLKSAELRGVVIAAAARACEVKVISKALISRTYGDRKVDEYLQDDAFWDDNTTGGQLRRMSREAAMLIVASRSG